MLGENAPLQGVALLSRQSRSRPVRVRQAPCEPKALAERGFAGESGGARTPNASRDRAVFDSARCRICASRAPPSFRSVIAVLRWREPAKDAAPAVEHVALGRRVPVVPQATDSAFAFTVALEAARRIDHQPARPF